MKKLIIASIVIGIIGSLLIKNKDGLLFFGLSSFVLGFLGMKFFNYYRCAKCKKWFSYKLINKNYTDFVDSANPWSDDVTVNETQTLECSSCKNRITRTHRVTKTIKGNASWSLKKEQERISRNRGRF